jgi:manganese/iron transport system permease protein
MTGVSLFVGGTAFGLVVVAAVLSIGAAKVLDDASIVGVVLAGSFALGVLLLSTRPSSSRDLSAFLVGSVLTVTRGDIATTLAGGALVIVVIAAVHKELLLQAFDRGAAAVLGYRNWVLDAVVLVAITIVMVTAIPAVGTLLAVALLTVPALTARLWCARVGPIMAVAAAIGAASGVIGLCAAALWRVAAGGAIALAAGGFFVGSLLVTSVRPARRTHGFVPPTA